MLAEFQVTPVATVKVGFNGWMRVELANPSPFPAFSTPCAGPAQSFTGAIARVIVATFLFAGSRSAKWTAKSEIDPAPRLLTLEGNLIFANTTLFAQNEQPPLSPEQFNPDPGASQRVGARAPPELFPPVLPQLPEYGEEALPRSLELPRKGVREVVPRRKKLEYETHPLSEQGEGLLPSSRPEPNRWFIGFGRWKRYADPSTETPYQSELQLWHPICKANSKATRQFSARIFSSTLQWKISFKSNRASCQRQAA